MMIFKPLCSFSPGSTAADFLILCHFILADAFLFFFVSDFGNYYIRHMKETSEGVYMDKTVYTVLSKC